MITTETREYRSFALTTQDNVEGTEEEKQEDSFVVEGRAVVFDTPEVMYEENGVQYKEQIDHNAFIGAKIDDVILNVNHEGQALARTRNHTLDLDFTDEGLDISADMSKSRASRDAYEAVKNGLLDKMSFSFVVAEDDYDTDTHTRTIRKIARLFDVSLVNFPAYESTGVSARSYFAAKAEAERTAAEAAEKEAEASRAREEQRASLSERLTKLMGVEV